jgi:hypothetical protein
MNQKNEFKENSEAVRAHLEISQSVIQRMAANSAASKAWCVSLVSAILVLVADKGKPQFAYIAIIPTLLFFALDVYYLALEKMFRTAYNNFIHKLHSGKIKAEDLFAMKPSGHMPDAIIDAVKSFSIWPFYIVLLLMIFVTKKIIISD